MGKKKHKRQAMGQAQNGWGEGGFGQGACDARGAGMGAGMGANMGAGAFDPNMFNGMAGANGLFDAALGAQGGLLHGLQGMLGSRQTEQFILGALIGAAAVYVLGDEEMRGKLAKTAMKLYAGVAGGFEEIKEQMADIRAEVEAEERS